MFQLAQNSMDTIPYVSNIFSIYQKGNVKLINADCMEIMAKYPDNYFDLLIADPPYRDAKDNAPVRGMKEKQGLTMDKWQDKPNENYFKEFFRISKNQIIWGANNFIEHLYSTNCIIFWNKIQILDNFSDGELAWTSFDSVAKYFEYCWSGNRYGTKNNIKGVGKPTIRIHPTEKPIELYNWIYDNFSKREMKIIDPYGGSFNSAISSFYFKHLEYVGIEIDKSNFELSVSNFKEKTLAQLIDFNCC